MGVLAPVAVELFERYHGLNGREQESFFDLLGQTAKYNASEQALHSIVLGHSYRDLLKGLRNKVPNYPEKKSRGPRSGMSQTVFRQTWEENRKRTAHLVKLAKLNLTKEQVQELYGGMQIKLESRSGFTVYDAEKTAIGERLFVLISQRHPNLAGKITGMLLELDSDELHSLLKSPLELQARVLEALNILRDQYMKESLQERWADKLSISSDDSGHNILSDSGHSWELESMSSDDLGHSFPQDSDCV